MDKPTPRPIKIIDPSQGGTFTMVPRFWVDNLMDATCHHTKNGERVGAAPRIPASFWKFTFVLWRYITSGNVNRETRMSMREFPVRSDAAVRWTAAYSVSGLFTVGMGKWTPRHDEPTSFACCCDASQQDWEIFTRALDLTLNKLKDAKIREWGNVGAFRVALALEVDHARTQAGLAPVNSAFLAEAPNLKDNKGRPIAKLKKGLLEPQFYGNPKREPWTEGHPRGCPCEDCLNAEQVYRAEFEDRQDFFAAAGEKPKSSW